MMQYLNDSGNIFVDWVILLLFFFSLHLYIVKQFERKVYLNDKKIAIFF